MYGLNILKHDRIGRMTPYTSASVACFCGTLEAHRLHADMSGSARASMVPMIDMRAGKLYTLVTGANERRWDKMKDQLETVAQSFIVNTKYSG